jgi:hypothetical protein
VRLVVSQNPFSEKIRLVTATALVVAFFRNGYGACVLYVQQLVTQSVGFFMIAILVLQGAPKEIFFSGNRSGGYATAAGANSLALLQR